MAQHYTFRLSILNTEGDLYHESSCHCDEDKAVKWALNKANLLMLANGDWRVTVNPLFFYVSSLILRNHLGFEEQRGHVRLWALEEVGRANSALHATEIRLEFSYFDCYGAAKWATKAKWTLSIRNNRRMFRRDI